MTGWQTHQSYLLPAWRELQETQHHTTLSGNETKSGQCPPQAWGQGGGYGEADEAWVPGQPGKPDTSGPASSFPGIDLTETAAVHGRLQLLQTGAWFLIPGKMETTQGANNSAVAEHGSTPSTLWSAKTETDVHRHRGAVVIHGGARKGTKGLQTYPCTCIWLQLHSCQVQKLVRARARPGDHPAGAWDCP